MTDASAIAAPLTKSAASPERFAGMVKAINLIDEKGIEGDIVECGIWKGGYLILARLMSPDRMCWGYDTFTGMPMPGEFDLHRSGKPAGKDWVGKSAVSLEDVMANLAEAGVYDPRYIRLVPGFVENTLLDPMNRPDKIALLRLDTDWYASTKVELEQLWPLLVPGGVMIVDDYGHWMGASKAVNEFFGDLLNYEMLDYTAMMMIKSHEMS